MTEKNQVSIEITGSGSKFDQVLNRTHTGINAFGTSVKAQFASISHAIDVASEHFGFFGRTVTAFTSGMILKKMFSVSDFMPIDNALLMLQTNLHLSARELDGFKTQLANLAVEAGADMDIIFAKAAKLSRSYREADSLTILRESLRGAKALTQDEGEMTDRVVQIMKMYKKGATDAKDIVDALIASRANIEQLDIIFQRGILKGGAGKDYKEVLALIGGLNKAGADSSRVVTAVENMMTIIEQKTATLRASGINPFKINPETGAKEKKTIVELLDDFERILNRAKKRGKVEQFVRADFESALGGGSYEAINFLISQRDKLKKAVEDQGKAGQIAAELSVQAEEKWEHQLGKIKQSIASIKTDLSFIYDLAKKPVKLLADSPNAVKTAAYGTAIAALAVGGYMVAKQGRGFLRSLGGTAAGIAMGKALEAATGVTPVFVTNWPSVGAGHRMLEYIPPAGRTYPQLPGPGRGPLSLPGPVIDLPRGSSAAVKVVDFLGKTGAMAAAGMLGYEVGTGLNWALSKIAEWGTGGKYKGEGWLGDALYDYLHKADNPKMEVNVYADRDGRISVEANNTAAHINMPRGFF